MRTLTPYYFRCTDKGHFLPEPEGEVPKEVIESANSSVLALEQYSEGVAEQLLEILAIQWKTCSCQSSNVFGKATESKLVY